MLKASKYLNRIMTEASLKKKISSAGRRARVSMLRTPEIFSEK
jgi:hypothetical protein